MNHATKLLLMSGSMLSVMACTTTLPPPVYPDPGPQIGYPTLTPAPLPAPAPPPVSHGGQDYGYQGGPSQLVLFDGSDFYGISRVIEGPEGSLGYIDYNDRAASLDIRGGGAGWLVCKDINFEGPCLVARETIDDLDDFGMGDKISSVRPLDPRNPYPHGTIFGVNSYGELVFYESDFFGNLSEMDPYDAYGYAAYDYGYVDVYQTGRYGDYGRYGQYNPYNPYRDYGYDNRNWSGYRGPTNADIVLYRDHNYSGSAYGLNRSAWDLSTLYFNDEVSSIEIRSGRWEVCTDSNFRGNCQIIDASVSSLGPLYLNDTISSVRRVGRNGNRGRGHGNGGGYAGGGRDHDGRNGGRGGNRRGDRNSDLVLYEHGNYEGRSVGVRTDIPNVGTLGLNDRISSLQIRSGVWELCSDANYRGRCQIVDASTTNLNGIRLNDSISSLRRVSDSGNRGDRGRNRDRDNDRGRDRNRDRDNDGGRNRDQRDQNADRDRNKNRGSAGQNRGENRNSGGQRPNVSPPPPPPQRNDDLIGGPNANDRSLPPGVRAVRRDQTRDANSIGRLTREERDGLERARRDAANAEAQRRRDAQQVERNRQAREQRNAEDRQRRNAEMQRRREEAERMQAQQADREREQRQRVAQAERQAEARRQANRNARAQQSIPDRRQQQRPVASPPPPPPPPPVASPPPPPPPPPPRVQRPKESKQQRLIRNMQRDN